MIGIIGAMDVEIDELKRRITSPVTTRIAKIDFVCGEIENVTVCAARCNPGKVNAAMCAQIMIDRFCADSIINLGIGCSLAKNVAIKNVVIATEVCQYDVDTSGCGDPVGFISGLNVINIETDKALSDALALAAIRSGEKIHRGIVATGDYFIASNEVKNKISERFGAICGEMEGAAVGQVCYANGVPFAVLRSISDGGNADSAIDYPTFKSIAAKISTAAVIDYLKTQKNQLEI